MEKYTGLAGAVAALALSGAAQAELFDRGGGMIYDDTLKITWLSDWNYAETSGFLADARMDWATANDWANNLDYGGLSGWRLPSALNADASGPCDGYNCSGSEIGHMFYNNWGGRADTDPAGGSSGTNTANMALFTNVKANVYWSGTKYSPSSSDAWYFATAGGNQTFNQPLAPLYAVAVRDGDVTAVPEPETWVLMLVALGVMTKLVPRRPR